MRPFFLISNVFAMTLIALTVAGCGAGKGFVEGWRDNSPQESGVSPEAFCESQEGYSWINGSCQKDSGLNLNEVTTEQQCINVKNAFWTDNKCLHYTQLSPGQCERFQELTWYGDGCDFRAKVECEQAGKFYKDGLCSERPEVTVTGDLEQSVTRSAAFAPVTFNLPEGGIIKIVDTSCQGYFVVSGQQITANKDFKLPENQSSCSARLVVVRNGIESNTFDMKVSFSSGFLTYCSEPEKLEAPVLYFTLVLFDELKAKDCAEAAVALSAQVAIAFANNRKISRLDALYGLTSLRMLEITGGSVVDLKPLASLPNLLWLDLSNNKIADLSPLAGHKTLQELYLAGNPLATGDVQKTEQNCPTSQGTNAAVKAFCLAD